ncbi:MAG: hypothetical protein ACI4D7_10590 [Lachnospiraceae bacterium]
MGSSMDDIRRLCPDAEISQGLAIRGGSVERSEGEIKKWLTRMK